MESPAFNPRFQLGAATNTGTIESIISLTSREQVREMANDIVETHPLAAVLAGDVLHDSNLSNMGLRIIANSGSFDDQDPLIQERAKKFKGK